MEIQTKKILSLQKKFRPKELFLEKLIFLNSWVAITSILIIFIFIFKEALPILTSPEVQKEANLKLFFTQKMWQPVSDIPKYGLAPLILGTLKVVLIAILFSVPIALGAAIYTTEFAPARIKEFLKPAVEVLAGIPSVVLGFFALVVMATFFQNLFGAAMRLNAFNAGIALSFAIIPMIYSISEDALNSVPRSLKEASLALGANQWQTAQKIVLSVALPGVVAGIILGIARAIGETMIVLMASGNAAILSGNFFESVRAMSATIAAELAEVVFGSPHYSTLFFIGMALLLSTFIFNLLAHWLVTRLKIKLSGK